MKSFKIRGLEAKLKVVHHYKNTSSRVYVPSSWNRVAVIRLKDEEKEEKE